MVKRLAALVVAVGMVLTATAWRDAYDGPITVDCDDKTDKYLCDDEGA